jgi:hypothetical protein
MTAIHFPRKIELLIRDPIKLFCTSRTTNNDGARIPLMKAFISNL